MATLEIDFHCMCVFVPDPYAKDVGTVHVLMPTTKGHVHGEHASSDGNGATDGAPHAHVPPTPGSGEAHEHGPANEGEGAPHAHVPPAPGSGDAHEHGPANEGEGAPHAHVPPAAGSGDAHDNGPVPEGEGGDPDDDWPTDNGKGEVVRHVVRMLHPGFQGEPAGRSMEGWALVLGSGLAETTLAPIRPSNLGAELADLSALTGATLERRLVDNVPNPEVATRITLGAGRMLTSRAEATWLLGGKEMRMAHRVVWRVEGILPDQPLRWERIGPVENDAPPLARLDEVGPDGDGVYRLNVYHVMENQLPPDPTGKGRLNASEVSDHFRALYTLFGQQNPDQRPLPKLQPGHGGKVNCGVAQASLAS